MGFGAAGVRAVAGDWGDVVYEWEFGDYGCDVAGSGCYFLELVCTASLVCSPALKRLPWNPC